MTCGLVLYVSYSLLEWQAVKLTFFAPRSVKNNSDYHGPCSCSLITKNSGQKLRVMISSQPG